jgi:dihydrofolate reductase
MAQTVDGKIGKTADHFPDWTGSADKKLFAAMSRAAGVVIMGSRTFDTIGSPLPGRKNIVLTRNKARRSKWENLEFTDRSPERILTGLEQEGYTHAILAGGSLINTLFASVDLIDELVVTVSPLIFGRGLPLFADNISMALELDAVEQIDSNVACLRYRVLKGLVP